MVIDVKEAANSAIRFFQELAESTGTHPKQLRVEEVEFLSGSNTWLITLGFDVDPPHVTGGVTASLYTRIGRRELRVFEINADSGEVKSMKLPEGGK